MKTALALKWLGLSSLLAASFAFAGFLIIQQLPAAQPPAPSAAQQPTLPEVPWRCPRPQTGHQF